MSIILLILTVIATLLISSVIAKKKARLRAISNAPIINKLSLNAPDNYLISRYHTWAFPQGNLTKVGIDNFAVKCLGKVIIKHLASEGKKIKAGDKIIEAEVQGQKLSFMSPVGGTIKVKNTALLNNVVKDAYGNDWAFAIERDTEKNKLKRGYDSQLWLDREFSRFTDFLSENSLVAREIGVTMLDGGNFVEGILSTYNKDVLLDFQEEFLNGKTDA